MKILTNIIHLTFALIAFASLGLTASVRAVNPPNTPDPPGPLPISNTADGQLALAGVTGTYNSAFGIYALLSNGAANFNTGVGADVLLVNTADEQTAVGTAALFSNTTGGFNTANGAFALFSNTTGTDNTASRAEVLVFNNGSENTATGAFALNGNTIGSGNTATGAGALFSNVTGGANTASGFQALFSNTSANNNTAVGAEALLTNTGANNTALGAFALSSNQGDPDPSIGNGIFNNAVGANSLFSNTSGSSNNALGESALLNNVTAAANTAVGDTALANNDSDAASLGSFNTAVGASGLFSNVDGNSNNAVGAEALSSNVDGNSNNALGVDALLNNTTGNFNIAIGDSAGQNVTTADNVICIGTNVGGANASNSCYIGSIFGQTSSGGAAVLINSSGKLGTVTSSRRFKEEINAMEKASEALFALKPVTFRYKKEIDGAGTQQFGLVAEDVEKVNPDLVVRDKEGKPYSVRYEAVNAMLLNEFLKEHRKNQEQEAIISQLKATDAQQQKQIEALTVGLQKVSAQLELSKPAPQTVLMANHAW